MSDIQDYEEKIDFNASSTSSAKRRTPQTCANCSNHGMKVPLKDHKRYCKFRICQCEKCCLTAARRRVMRLQTAERRAQVQDEEMKRRGLLSRQLKKKSPSPVSNLERMDCDSSLSSHCSNPSQPIRRMTPPLAAQPTTLAGMGSVDSYRPLQYKALQAEELLEQCQKLLARFNYPWEMMPLMFAILKDSHADLEEASRRIDEEHYLEVIMDLCDRIKKKYCVIGKVASLVKVILKMVDNDPEKAWKVIEAAYEEFGRIINDPILRFYNAVPYTNMFSSAPAPTAIRYPHIYFPPIYHHPSTTLLSIPTACPPSPASHVPPQLSMVPLRPDSQAC